MSKERLATHRLLDRRKLTQRCTAEDGLEPNAGGGDSTLPTGSPKRGLQLWTSQAGGLSWSRCDRQQRASIRMGQATRPAVLKGFDECRIVLAQQ